MAKPGTATLVVIGLLAPAIVLAQLDNASILGTVLDASGAVIQRATVIVQSQGTGATFNLVTDANGNFFAPVLPVGIYKVTVSAKGFKTYVRDNITLHVADRTRLEFTLEPGEVSTQVSVVGEAPLVETGSTTLGGVVNQLQVSQLPLNGRSLTQLLVVVPGVVWLGPQRSMNGASQGRLFESGLKFLVDGGDSGQVDSDLADGGYQSAARISRASVDSIAEVRVVESSYSAEYGQSVGGVINFITKSGGNQIHGSLFEYFRNNVLDARNYFNVPPQVQPAFRLNQFGGTISGPIQKDKFFYFLNYEGVRQRLGVIQNTFVPAQAFRDTLSPTMRAVADLLPLPNGPVSPADPRLAQFVRGVSNALTEDTGSFKLDYAASANDRFFVRWNRNDSTTFSNFGVQKGGYRSVPAKLQLTKLNYTKTISPTLLNEASFAVNRWSAADPGSDLPETRAFPLTTIGGGSAGVGPTLFDLRVGNTSFTWLDTVSWVVGRHQLKFGGQIIRNRDNKELFLQTLITFLSLNEFAANKPFAVQTIGNPTVGMRNMYNHFFIQDDIQVSPSLTINAGLRYQYDTTPGESHGRIANFDVATGKLDPAGTPIFEAPKRNFGPRVGLAYTPFRSKRTVFRMGYGIFHSSLIAAQAQSLPGNLPGLNYTATVLSLTDPNLKAFPVPDLTKFQGATSYWAMHKDWKTAATQNWSFNIQQGFGENTVLQAGYIGNHSTHLVPYRNINAIIPRLGRRPFLAYGDIQQFFPCCNATYNALQASFKRRYSKSLTFNVHYTWSHSLDQGGLTFGAQAQNFDDYTTERSNSDYDVRHNFTLDYTYELPAIPGLPGVIGHGWQINGISVLRSGLPVTVTCGCDSNGNGVANERADVVPGVDPKPANQDIPTRQFTIAAFAVPKLGTVGNAGRNILRGPAAYNTDFSLFKNFRVREGHSLQLRAEVFNLFNTPQFSNPGANLAAPASFGRSLTTIATTGGFGSNRQIQFGLRYGF